jgi:protein-tyrosine-phosphatase
MKILFVCTGNTCRSPLAAALGNMLLTNTNCNSAGLYAPVPQPASHNSVQTAAKYGLDLSNHRSCQITSELVSQFDLVLTMTEAQKDQLLLQMGNPAFFDKCFTLAEFAGEKGDIPDPFGQTQEIYDLCGKRIYDLVLKMKQNMEG